MLVIHGVGATIGDTLTPLAAGALLVAFAWPDVLRAQLLPGILAGLLVWWGLAGRFPREVAARPSRRDLVMFVHPVFLAISLAQGLMMMARQVILTFLPLYIQIKLGRDAFELQGVYIAMLHAVRTVSAAGPRPPDRPQGHAGALLRDPGRALLAARRDSVGVSPPWSSPWGPLLHADQRDGAAGCPPAATSRRPPWAWPRW